MTAVFKEIPELSNERHRHERNQPNSASESWDAVYDVVAVGSGAAGLSAALFAAQDGMRVLVCEKSSKLGGTTALSNG